MNVPDRVSTRIQEPRKRLLNRVSACMLRELNYYQSAESKVTNITNDLNEVAAIDPEFIPQLACYARNSLNLRSVSNFLLAWADTHPLVKPTLEKYFNHTIRLPSDLLETVELSNILQGHTDKVQVSNSMAKLCRGKLKQFSKYQLGKYCSEGRRKRLLKKQKPKDVTDKGNMHMKKLIRLCHASEPAEEVMCMLGKRYPETQADFESSRLGGEFDPSRARKRMKLTTPFTWETEISQKGNKAETWEHLVDNKGLPFMAMLRNIRNLIETGVEPRIHEQVWNRLTNPTEIERCRLFPFRFFSAYEAISSPDDVSHRKDYGPRVNKREFLPKPQKVPKHPVTPEIMNGYKQALDQAVKLATALNTAPISGHSAIFVDVSGSMMCPISGGKGLGSVHTCMDMAFVMGLMLRNICESSEFVLLSSPGQYDPQKCWMPVDLKGDDLLGQMAVLHNEARKLGHGNIFPYDYMEELIQAKRKIDYWFILSDMIVAPGHVECEEGEWTITKILDAYRTQVNPDMKFVTIDFAGHGRSIIGADIESDSRNIVICGYSDSILRLVNEVYVSQVDTVREFANNLIESS